MQDLLICINNSSHHEVATFEFYFPSQIAPHTVDTIITIHIIYELLQSDFQKLLEFLSHQAII